MTSLNFSKFKINNQLPLLGLALVLALGYLPLTLFGGVIVDDWGAIQSGLGCTSRNASFWSCLSTHFPLWSNRPLAPVLITFFTLSFGTYYTGYLIANSIIYVGAVLITAHVLRSVIGLTAAIIFACLASFPEIAIPIIVSPVVQMTATASYLYWAISLYFICKAARTSSVIAWVIGYLFLMFSFLTYEVILPLLTLSVTLPYFYINKNRGYFFIKYLLKFLIPVLIILLITVAWQKIFAPIVFPVVYSRLSFNAHPDRILDIFNLWTSVFLDQIPALIKKIPAHLNHVEIASVLIFIVILLAVTWKIKKEALQKNQVQFVVIAAICFLSSSLIFILSGGGIDIGGYISRGLSSSWFSLSILIAAVASICFSMGKIGSLLGSGIMIGIAAINFSAFTIGRDNYIESWRLQTFILQDINRQMQLNGLEQIIVIGDVPGIVQPTFNEEVVFSAPWDFGSALAIISNGRGSGTVIDSRGGNFHLLDFKQSGLQIDGYWETGYHNLWLYDFDPHTKSGRLLKVNGAADIKRQINSHGKVYVGTPKSFSLAPGEKLEFSKAWSENSIIPSGEWGSMEDWGRWSLGNTAHLYIPPLSYRASKIAITARAFVTPKNPNLKIEVAINGNPPGQFTLSQFNHNVLEIPIPQNVAQKDPLVIEFKIINPRSPKDIGISADDERKLGIGLIDLAFIQ
jgi:hypothetical protein